MKSVGVVIVCRYNSTRLPGKILKKIEGKSILKRIYYRINQVISQNHIIVPLLLKKVMIESKNFVIKIKFNVTEEV